MWGREPSIADAIKRSFLARVPTEVVNQLLAHARLWEVPANHVFVTAGQQQRLGIIVEGQARVYRLRPNGEEITIRRIGPGAAFGMEAALEGTNEFNLSAITDCLFIPLQAAELVRLCSAKAALAVAIAEELTRLLVESQRHVESVRGSTVIQRVAGALLDQANGAGRVRLAITEERLAERIGASREAVGRQVRELVRAGLIAHERASFVLIDPRGLASMCSAPLERGNRFRQDQRDGCLIERDV